YLRRRCRILAWAANEWSSGASKRWPSTPRMSGNTMRTCLRSGHGALQDCRRCRRLMGPGDSHSVASNLYQFARCSHFDPCSVGLIGVDVHFREGVLAHPYQSPAEGQCAIFVVDADVDIFAVLDPQSRSIGGIGMDVPCRDDEAVGDEASGRPLDRDLRRSLKPAAVPHRHVDAEREAVGARNFDLRALAQRSEDRDTFEPALRTDERDPFFCGPVARLSQGRRLVEYVAL